ncbi:type II toxin-antitoxin system RelE/ParE family toxin [Nostoc sp. UHCC 0702]|nr:type II toxin-antitoxin system RelE/ParE family toxin [Nostoc sp. UHCC 0702]
MTYRIEISPTAKADVESIFLWMKDYSVKQAYRWVRGCYEIMLTLENFPNRCPLAIESQYLNRPVRQLFYKKQYRILFTVCPGNDQDSQDIVQIHRVLRAAQERLQDLSQLLGDEDD